MGWGQLGEGSVSDPGTMGAPGGNSRWELQPHLVCPSRSPRRHRSSSSSPVRPKERRDEEKKELKDSKKERQITGEGGFSSWNTPRCPVGPGPAQEHPDFWESQPNFLPAEEDLQGKTEEEIEMMKMMGFASFDTTKVSAGPGPLPWAPLCHLPCLGIIRGILGHFSSGEEGGRRCQCLRHQRVPEEEVQVCPPSFGKEGGFCFVK